MLFFSSYGFNVSFDTGNGKLNHSEGPYWRGGKMDVQQRKRKPFHPRLLFDITGSCEKVTTRTLMRSAADALLKDGVDVSLTSQSIGHFNKSFLQFAESGAEKM